MTCRGYTWHQSFELDTSAAKYVLSFYIPDILGLSSHPERKERMQVLRKSIFFQSWFSQQSVTHLIWLLHCRIWNPREDCLLTSERKDNTAILTQDVAAYKSYKGNCFKIDTFSDGASKAPIELKNNVSGSKFLLMWLIKQWWEQLIQSECDDLDS